MCVRIKLLNSTWLILVLKGVGRLVGVDNKYMVNLSIEGRGPFGGFESLNYR